MEKEKSCGCIIIRDNEVLLVQQNKGHWGFPKGHVEGEETEKQTALREVKEETNLDVNIINDKRYVITYETDKHKLKDVVFFLAEPKSNDISRQEIEIKDIQWFKYKDALEMLTYKNTAEVFKAVMKDIN